MKVSLFQDFKCLYNKVVRVNRFGVGVLLGGQHHFLAYHYLHIFILSLISSMLNTCGHENVLNNRKDSEHVHIGLKIFLNSGCHFISLFFYFYRLCFHLKCNRQIIFSS